MKKSILCSLMLAASVAASAQSLDKMQWFNEPTKWEIKNNSLTMNVTPQSDYWRISHYGFTVDDAPFLYTMRGGEFEVKVKVAGDYEQARLVKLIAETLKIRQDGERRTWGLADRPEPERCDSMEIRWKP